MDTIKRNQKKRWGLSRVADVLTLIAIGVTLAGMGLGLAYYGHHLHDTDASARTDGTKMTSWTTGSGVTNSQR